MPLIFPRSRLAGNGTSIEEGKEDEGESNSMFSKVEGSLGGEQYQTVSVSRSGALIGHRSSVTTHWCASDVHKNKKKGIVAGNAVINIRFPSNCCMTNHLISVSIFSKILHGA